MRRALSIAPVIRPARPGDVPFLRGLAQEAYAPYIRRIGRRPAPMDADFDRHLREDTVLVAECDAGPVGYAVAVESHGNAVLDNIAVAVSRQGQGIGRALIGAVEEHFRLLGWRRYTPYTNEAMHENVAYYSKLGFRETRRAVEAGFRRIYFERDI